VRKLGVIAAVVLVLSLSACTSSTAARANKSCETPRRRQPPRLLRQRRRLRRQQRQRKSGGRRRGRCGAKGDHVHDRRSGSHSRPSGRDLRPGQGFRRGQAIRGVQRWRPTGLVTHVVWKSWGGREAVGTGESEYVAPNQDVAEGSEQPATVVAFQARYLPWRFHVPGCRVVLPSARPEVRPDQYENICTGSYVTSATTALTCPPSRSKWRTGRNSEGRRVNER